VGKVSAGVFGVVFSKCACLWDYKCFYRLETDKVSIKNYG
jgi:hypothetical protein